MSPIDLCLLLLASAAIYVCYVVISDRIRLRDAKRFVAAILSNRYEFIDLVKNGKLTDEDFAELLIREAAEKLSRPLHQRLRRALNEHDNRELIFEIAVISKVLTDKRELATPQITIGDGTVILHDLFLISGKEIQEAA